MLGDKYKGKNGRSLKVVALIQNGRQPAYIGEVHKFCHFLRCGLIKYVHVEGTILPQANVVIYQDSSGEWFMRSQDSFIAMCTPDGSSSGVRL